MYLNDESLDMELSEIPGDTAILLVLKALALVANSAITHSKRTRMEPPIIIGFPTSEEVIFPVSFVFCSRKWTFGVATMALTRQQALLKGSTKDRKIGIEMLTCVF